MFGHLDAITVAIHLVDFNLSGECIARLGHVALVRDLGIAFKRQGHIAAGIKRVADVNEPGGETGHQAAAPEHEAIHTDIQLGG